MVDAAPASSESVTGRATPAARPPRAEHTT